jgi:chromatin assembly factor 1 subunit B
MLASAGDDGNILLWVPAENAALHATNFGEDGLEDKETWRIKTMCRSTGSEIYDLAWSPDGVYFITGQYCSHLQCSDRYVQLPLLAHDRGLTT